jgi:hypothetical protein
MNIAGVAVVGARHAVPLQTSAAEQSAEKAFYFVIPSEARNLSVVQAQQQKEKFLASLGMTKGVGHFFRSL